MASRTTRNKLRHHAKQAIDRLDSVMSSLKLIDEIAEQRSDYINEKLPVIVHFGMLYRDALTKFRDGL